MSYSVSLDSFVHLEEKWWELLTGSVNNHIFLTPQWQTAWWQVFGNGHTLFLLVVHKDSELMAIAPMMLQNERLSFIGSSDVCDYMDFIVRQGQEDSVFTRLLDYLEAVAWKTINLECLLPSSPVLTHLAPLAKQRGYHVQITQMDTSPRVSLPPSWEEYLALLKAKDRHELRRKLRRLERAKATSSYAITKKDKLPHEMESFFELFKMSDFEKTRFMTDQKRAFFETMVSSLAEEGYVRLSFLEVGGVRASSSLCFDYGNEVYLYNSAYDPTYAPLSVSLLLKVFCLREAIAQGKKCFDFLRGNESYKYDLGGQDVPVYNCIISRA
ncbi:MAG: hypothetical protein A2144_07715 [Chloroflexi bacterium RBG_16_50_9]|nr:MAG: hypothetical protein A2144_07715 [Chloroflexi bacterium RBG_16_50_9]